MGVTLMGVSWHCQITWGMQSLSSYGVNHCLNESALVYYVVSYVTLNNTVTTTSHLATSCITWQDFPCITYSLSCKTWKQAKRCNHLNDYSRYWNIRSILCAYDFTNLYCGYRFNLRYFVCWIYSKLVSRIHRITWISFNRLLLFQWFLPVD